MYFKITKMNKRFKKTLKTIFVFTLVFSWIFSGWPQIWNNPPFPPEIQETKAADATNSPTLAVDDATVGTVAWGTVTNVYSSNDADASVALGRGITSHYIKATGFNFSIPTGSTIDGIVVEVERACNSTTFFKDSTVRIVKGGVIGATNKADTVTIWPLTDTYKTYGASTDVWGETWTADDINSSTFGFAISAQNSQTTGSSETRTGYVDHIRITVYYTPPANSPPSLTVSQPDGTDDKVTVGDSYNITYSLTDTDDSVTAAFYYDTDIDMTGGTVITGACATAAEGTGVTCSWDTTGVTAGSYYVYGVTSDGVNPEVKNISPGQITIFSTAISIRNVADTADVATITFPSGDASAVISNPTGNVNVQVLTATASEAAPVAILKSATAYTLWYNVTSTSTWGDAVASEKLYTIAIAGDLDLTTFGTSAYNMTVWGTDQVTSQTLAAGVNKELYLQVTISALWGKSGTSTLTILGEAL